MIRFFFFRKKSLFKVYNKKIDQKIFFIIILTKAKQRIKNNENRKER